ncbi:FBP domain-containing protein [Occultella glacieicola]|uniref:FBP domain-containing protein n=1 Tax=Occultella glacieicola TaxID=2518684 RepID=A0ABY2DXF5_9MICO|nr:FBP domain-containing protein [Occultella glacieicola]TDE88819.1 FBP domain-containing protein [Occultella glacieicola]
MNPLTEKQIRNSFINASRGEANRAVLPELATIAWDRLDYLGWQDPKAPLSAYAVLEIDGEPTGIRLQSGDARTGRSRRQAMCAWCEDVVETGDVVLYVARRGGEAGRRGNTVGTLICRAFACSANVRRTPTPVEASDQAAREQIVQRRIAGLRERSERFVREIASTR